jgi:hypothetical protein
LAWKVRREDKSLVQALQLQRRSQIKWLTKKKNVASERSPALRRQRKNALDSQAEVSSSDSDLKP